MVEGKNEIKGSDSIRTSFKHIITTIESKTGDLQSSLKSHVFDIVIKEPILSSLQDLNTPTLDTLKPKVTISIGLFEAFASVEEWPGSFISSLKQEFETRGFDVELFQCGPIRVVGRRCTTPPI